MRSVWQHKKPLPFTGGVGEGYVVSNCTCRTNPTPFPSPEGEGGS